MLYGGGVAVEMKTGQPPKENKQTRPKEANEAVDTGGPTSHHLHYHFILRRLHMLV